MIDFKKLVEGMSFEWKGVTYLVAELHYVRKGWVRAILTLDGLPVSLHRTCICDRDDGEIPVVDLVTEAEYLCCVKCRCLVAD